MATGWAKEGAVQEQIDATVTDAVKRAQSRLPQGPSLSHCAECGAEIPQARQTAVPGFACAFPVRTFRIARPRGSAATIGAAARIVSCGEYQPGLSGMRLGAGPDFGAPKSAGSGGMT